MSSEPTSKPYMAVWGGRHPLHDKLMRAFLEHGRPAVVARVLGIGRATVNRWLVHNRDDVAAARKALAAKAPVLEQRIAELERIVFGPKRAA